jgi:hypothetical protein
MGMQLSTFARYETKISTFTPIAPVHARQLAAAICKHRPTHKTSPHNLPVSHASHSDAGCTRCAPRSANGCVQFYFILFISNLSFLEVRRPINHINWRVEAQQKIMLQ